jgi:Transglycosylase SLT domain
LRLTPRATAIAAVVTTLVFAGSAVAVLPAFSDAQTGPVAAVGPVADMGTIGHASWLDQLPSWTAAPATPAPSWTPPPSATPTASPSPTAAPTAKPKPKAKPKPITYSNTVAGARAYVRARIGTHQYNCINAIFTRESKWNPRAGSVTSAYGIPQAFPGSKMAAFGSNWRTSPITQVKWGIWYVDNRYGSACAAWFFWQAHGWY